MFKWGGECFDDITEQSGISGDNMGTRGVVAADLTGTGSPDLFCLSNEGQPNDLFINDGVGRFTRTDTVKSGIADIRALAPNLAGLGQGVTAADFDNDGRQEIYCCIRKMPNRFWKRQEDGTWKDIAAQAGVDCVNGGDGATFADLWNRGLQDLIVAVAKRPNPGI